MSTEDDTIRILRRPSFDDLITKQAAFYGMTFDSIYKSIASRMLNGAQPTSDWNTFWPGWTFDEAMREVIRRKENDNRQES